MSCLINSLWSVNAFYGYLYMHPVWNGCDFCCKQWSERVDICTIIHRIWHAIYQQHANIRLFRYWCTYPEIIMQSANIPIIQILMYIPWNYHAECEHPIIQILMYIHWNYHAECEHLIIQILMYIPWNYHAEWSRSHAFAMYGKQLLQFYFRFTSVITSLASTTHSTIMYYVWSIQRFPQVHNLRAYWEDRRSACVHQMRHLNNFLLYLEPN